MAGKDVAGPGIHTEVVVVIAECHSPAGSGPVAVEQPHRSIAGAGDEDQAGGWVAARRNARGAPYTVDLMHHRSGHEVDHVDFAVAELRDDQAPAKVNRRVVDAARDGL